jgi:hypothetical protein
VVTCQNCGNENPEGSRFCSNCGTRLVAPDPPASPQPGRSEPGDGEHGPAAVPAPPAPPPTAFARPIRDTGPSAATELPPTHPEWRMSSAGPLPDPPRRRRWLWIVLGLIGFCVLVCALIVLWGSTIGADTVNNWLIEAEAEATRQAGS